jgi:hypothetical protein
LFYEISTVSKPIKSKVKMLTLRRGLYSLFDWLGSREPHKTNNPEFCPRFFYVRAGTPYPGKMRAGNIKNGMK